MRSSGWNGALIVVRALEPAEGLCRRVRTLVEEAFETPDPATSGIPRR